MGLGESKLSPGPKIFFLVFGGPSITYRRGVDNGPLIFNVDPMERRVEPPASAETRKCPVYCSAKQPFKLVRVRNEGDNRTTEGWRLQFSIDSVSYRCRLKLFVGVSLNYEHSNGFDLEKSSPAQSQYLVAEEDIPVGNVVPFTTLHTPIHLNLLETTASAGHDEVFTRLRSSPLAVEITCDGPREGGSADSGQTKMFIFLTFNKSDLDESSGVEMRDSIPAACVKQYIFSQGELFEADDVFDLRGDDAPPPSGPSPVGGASSPEKLAEDVEVDDDATCVVCLTNDRNTTIIPCRHMCVCAECAALLQQNSGKCPMCRREIQKLLTLAS